MDDQEIPIAADELASAFSGPAPFTNKFYVTLSATTARIAFCEQGAEGNVPLFRSAASMALTDFLLLRDLMVRLTENMQVVKVDTPPDAKTSKP